MSAGCGDTAAGALGAGVTEPGQAFDTAGTAAVLGGCVDAFVPDVGGTLMNMRSPLSGRYYGLGYVAGAGPGRRVARRDLRRRRRPSGPGRPRRRARPGRRRPVPGADGVLVSPHFQRPRLPGRRRHAREPPRGHAGHDARPRSCARPWSRWPSSTPATSTCWPPSRRARPSREWSAPGAAAAARCGTRSRPTSSRCPYTAAGEVDAGTRGAASLAAVSAGRDPWEAPADQTRTWVPGRGRRTCTLRPARARYRRWTAALSEPLRRRRRTTTDVDEPPNRTDPSPTSTPGER